MPAVDIPRLFSMRFEEGPKSWIGSYQEAKVRQAQEKAFQHLQDECAICLEKFLSADRVIVLSCTHGLHELCFRPWEQQTCPWDHTVAEGPDHIEVFNLTFSFPPKVQKLGIWLQTGEGFVNECLSILASGLGLTPTTSFKEEVLLQFKDFGAFLQSTLQDALDAYNEAQPRDGLLQKAEAHVQEFRQVAGQQRIKILLELLAGRYSIDLEAAVEFARSQPDLLSRPNLIQFFVDVISDSMQVSLDAKDLHPFLLYVSTLISKASITPEFKAIQEGADRIFCEAKKEEISALSTGQATDQEKRDFIGSMNPKQLLRLNRLVAKDDAPEAQLVREVVHALKRSKRLKIIWTVTPFCLVILCLLVLKFAREDNAQGKV